MAELDYQKVYAEDVLRNLDATRRAVEGVIYKRKDGEFFVGTNQNILRLVQTAKQTPIGPLEGVEPGNLEEVIIQLIERIEDLEEDVDIIKGDYLTSKDKEELKCFTMAMVTKYG